MTQRQDDFNCGNEASQAQATSFAAKKPPHSGLSLTSSATSEEPNRCGGLTQETIVQQADASRSNASGGPIRSRVVITVCCSGTTPLTTLLRSKAVSLSDFISKKPFVAGYLASKVGYRKVTRMRMPKRTGGTARHRRAPGEQSLSDRGCGISCTAAMPLRKIGDNNPGNTRGANAMWMPPARNPCEAIRRGGRFTLVPQVSCSWAQAGVCAPSHQSQVPDKPQSSSPKRKPLEEM
ncbi:uncharacterized protein LOC119176908 [Rhipicephalus microplus]|uniref:uncharacterized protein LOC119176908 n=1 Tax=Rhipicephalus microplus TaxID=6941 RepID=UPI003F6B2952